MSRLEIFIGGLDFGESPRWHDGRLWYSDFFQQTVYAVTPDGGRSAMWKLDDRPSGLGWMPDGTLLVVSMVERQVLREVDGELVVHADLSGVAGGWCNDMVVDAVGNAYVGNFGFDYEAHEQPVPADLALVRPDGTVTVVARNLAFPNGAVITPDGSRLIIGESIGERLTAFTINSDASLGDRQPWADVSGIAPDGCTLDAEGAVWVADATGSRVVRVFEGGTVAESIDVPMNSFACTLGGADGTTLFVVGAPSGSARRSRGSGTGTIFCTEVAVPHAGLP